MAAEAKNRNKAIVAALCKRFSEFSLDPKNFESESFLECDIASLLAKIVHLSSNESSLRNHEEVMKWVQFANNVPSTADACSAALKGLNDDLAQRSVLLGEGFQPSEADIVVFSALHSFVSHLSEEDVQKFKNVMRWMDYIQNVVDFGGALASIVIKKPQFEHFLSKNVDKADGELTSRGVTQISRS